MIKKGSRKRRDLNIDDPFCGLGWFTNGYNLSLAGSPSQEPIASWTHKRNGQDVYFESSISARNDKYFSAGNVHGIFQLPKGPLDHIVGYIFRVRVKELLKSDRRVSAGQTVDVLRLSAWKEQFIYLRTQQVLLTLAAFSPKKEDFEKTSVLEFGQSTSQQGKSFDLQRSYYVVAGDANGVIAITNKNQKLIQEIRTSIRRR